MISNTIKFSTSPKVSLWKLRFKKSNLFTVSDYYIWHPPYLYHHVSPYASHSALLATNHQGMTPMEGPVLVRSASMQWMKLCELTPFQDILYVLLIWSLGMVLLCAIHLPLDCKITSYLQKATLLLAELMETHMSEGLSSAIHT